MSPDLISCIILRQCRLKLRRVGYYSTGARDPEYFPVIVVEIRAGNARGFGEFVPTSILYPGDHLGKSQLDEWRTITQHCERLIGQDPRLLDQLIPAELRGYDCNSMVDGINFALHDLVGRMAGLPVWALLGGLRQPWVQAMTVVHTAAPADMAALARQYYQQSGYRWLKLKPNCDLEADRETMQRIRRDVEPSMRFVIDPNEALKLDPQGVVDYVNALRPEGLEICEDPIRTDWQTWAWMQQRTEVALMLDGPARTPQNVLEIVNHRCGRLINIHANWAGGFQAAIHKARIAELGGLETFIGSTYYSGIGTAAYQTLSAVLPGRHLCEQSNTSEDVCQLAVRQEYACRDGKIYIADAPGLGFEVDDEALDSLTTERIVIGKGST